MVSKKICFITTRNVFNTTCLPKYAKILNNQFDIIYWDQHGIEEDAGALNHYRFYYPMSYGKSKLKKIIGYIKFRSYVKKVIKKNKYDKLIVLPTQAAVLIFDELVRKYKNKFIIDIRDYTAENKKWFYEIEKRIIKNSGLAVITSPAYKKFLPDHEYIVSHNATEVSKDIITSYRNRKRKSKIIISCIGSIRFIQQFQRVIDSFKNDDRYELRFIGRGSEHLESYIDDNQINNVVLIGRFESRDTIKYYLETDIIMNLYGNNNPFLDYALSNKLYYSAMLGAPIIVSPGTYMEEITTTKGFGFSYDITNVNMKETLYEYYSNLDWDKMYKQCDLFMKEINEENRVYISEIINFFNR